MSFSRVQDILLDDSASACCGVERWMFRFGFSFCTTAGVDVDVEQVSERVLRSRLNAPSHHSTLAQVCTPRTKSPNNPPITMCKMAYTYLRSLEDAPASTVIFFIVVWASDCYSAPQTSTFNSPGSRGRGRARPWTNTAFPTRSPYYGQDSMDIPSKTRTKCSCLGA